MRNIKQRDAQEKCPKIIIIGPKLSETRAKL